MQSSIQETLEELKALSGHEWQVDVIEGACSPLGEHVIVFRSEEHVPRFNDIVLHKGFQCPSHDRVGYYAAGCCCCVQRSLNVHRAQTMFVEMLTAYLLRETLSAGSHKSHVQTIRRFFKQYSIDLEAFVDIGFINNSYDVFWQFAQNFL